MPPDAAPADRILDLTVYEPAMGSAAFLNEAVNQLRGEVETGRRIPHADYADELPIVGAVDTIRWGLIDFGQNRARNGLWARYVRM